MQRVLILGATSAVAAEVAHIFSRRGDRLHLVGRNRDKLDDVVRRCRETEVTSATADLADVEANEGVVRAAIAALDGIDVVLIAHGDLGDQLESERSFAEAETV